MSNLKNTFLAIYREHKGLFALMVVTFLFGMFLMIYTIIMIDPNSAVVKIGYGDIGGYRDGAWTNMLTFPILAGILGVVHNFLTMKLFEKHADGIAKVFIAVTFLLLIGTLIVFLRLLGES